MTPNNSDQAAMHDELRARLSWLLRDSDRSWDSITGLDATFVTVSLDGFRDTITQAIAALSTPASEAVAAFEVFAKAFGANLERFSKDKTRYKFQQTAALWDAWKLAHTTPQPAPAAHAGGEAVAVDALRELIDAAVKAGRELDEYGALTSAQAVMDAVKKARALLSGGAARERAK